VKQIRTIRLAINSEDQGDTSATTSSANDEREYLSQLFLLCDGPNWTKNANWCSDMPLREWHGVRVNTRGRICKILLGRNKLKGFRQIMNTYLLFKKKKKIKLVYCSACSFFAKNINDGCCK
jgi:hypothetical protein